MDGGHLLYAMVWQGSARSGKDAVEEAKGRALGRTVKRFSQWMLIAGTTGMILALLGVFVYCLVVLLGL